MIELKQQLTECKQGEETLKRNNKLLNSLCRAQSSFIAEGDASAVFETLLRSLLSFTQSEWGFIGEILYPAECKPHFKILTIASLGNDEIGACSDKSTLIGLELPGMKTLLDAVITTGKLVIASYPATNPEREGVPEERPFVDAFLGMPFYKGEELIGMVGIANRPGGYNRQMVEFLQPYLPLCASLIEAQIKDRNRKQVEETMRRQLAAIEGAIDGIAILDQDWKYIYLNAARLKLFGYEDPTELVGKSWEALYDDAEIRRIEQEIFPILRRNGYWEGRTIGKRRDRSQFCEELSLTLLQDGGLICLGRDITKRCAVDLMKDALVSVVSHELRTPLTSIRGSLGLLANGGLGTVNEKAQRLLEIAINNTNRLIRLVNDILDIERLESGRVPLNLKRCNATALMSEAVAVMQAMADKAGVAFSMVPCEAPLWADEDRIIQTLTNLLSNAIKFSPAGATVQLTAKPQETCILFQISDQGRGIPPDKLDLIFSRFQQVDASDARQKGGTGLGLAICRGIVRQHGGRIWAESVPGVGSTFSFTLPAIKQKAADLRGPDQDNEPDLAVTSDRFEITTSIPSLLLNHD